MTTQQLPAKAKLTASQEKAMTEARVAFMRACPFFAYYYYDQMVEHPTYAMPTAATDGRRIMYNPSFMEKLKPQERCFVLAHEVYHTIWRHPLRMREYRRTGLVRRLPYIAKLYNVAADYVINHVLVSLSIGLCNPEWLYDPTIHGNQLVEDVYEALYKKLPPPPPQGRPCPEGEPGEGEGKSEGKEGRPMPRPSVRGMHQKGGKPDLDAKEGQFDEVLEPYVDPATGREDVPGDNEFKEAIARAAAAAKASGGVPGAFKSMIDEIMEPQVQWKEHIRMLVTGKVGHRRETWATPNRRRLVLNPIIYLPGRTGHGARLVVCAVDSSGSVDDNQIAAFMAEMGAILNDCRPKEVMVIWCDHAVQRIDTARSLDELADIRVKGAPGRGGTSFKPPFKHVEKAGIVPDTLVYLTDMYPNDGWPVEPKYPVIWCATTPVKAPFGDTVQIKV